MLAFFTASYHYLLWTPNSIGVPEGPLGRVWPSLPHLDPTVRNSTGNFTRTRTQLSYIIVRRSLDLWNRMFNRHQAEITVRQFRGHSLPVHQSMRVPWEFFSSSHFINQFPPTRFPLINAVRMFHLLPVHHLGMAFLAGSKGQNTTVCLFSFSHHGMLLIFLPIWSGSLIFRYSFSFCRRLLATSL